MPRYDLRGGVSVQITGGLYGGAGPGIVQIADELGGIDGFTTGEAVIFARMSVEGPNVYYEDQQQAIIPARPDRATVIFPPSEFTANVYRIGISVEVPGETRGGVSMVEVWVPDASGETRVASFRGGTAMFIEEGDKAWEPLYTALFSRQPWALSVGGFESFHTWTEPRAYVDPITITVRAWGET